MSPDSCCYTLQEEGGRQVVTHPRIMESTVRKADDRRKRKRADKAERKAAEESAQEQEVKRLKNLKGQQIQERSDCLNAHHSRACSTAPASCSYQCSTYHVSAVYVWSPSQS